MTALQVKLSDEFENKKKGKNSQTYRIVYRSNEKALSKEEVRYGSLSGTVAR